MESSQARDFTHLFELIDQLGREFASAHADDVDTQARFPHETFTALKQHRMLSCYVPRELGGDGLTVTEVALLCERLGRYCASTAMVYAMHQIQVACLVHHGLGSDYFRGYLQRLVSEQLLLASATTELGVGGDLRSSLCALQRSGDSFTIKKEAPVISYALDADAILVTCRANPEAPASDQLHLLLEKETCELKEICGWDTMGFRGTCSSGFSLSGSGAMEQVLPVPFATILAETMHPVAHLTWGALWTGMAQDAVHKARSSVQAAARKNPDLPPVAPLRLAELNEQLFSMRAGVLEMLNAYQALVNQNNTAGCSNFVFATRMNNVKLRCSEMVVDIVGKALMIVGISGYRNDSSNSLCRHIRDAYGAALMVNNDRIRGHNATMQLGMRG